MSETCRSQPEILTKENEPTGQERFERRQRHVAKLIRLDQLMSAWGEIKPEELFVCIESLPDRLKTAATEIINTHLERIKKTKQIKSEISRLAMASGYKNTPNGFGKFLYAERVQIPPLGEVRLESAGETLIMTLANPEDYRNFCDPNLYLLPDKKFRQRQQWIDDTSGSYHTKLISPKQQTENYTRLTIGGELNFVLLVKASLQDPEHLKIVKHEHQHHINHSMLNLFDRSELKPKKESAIDSAIARPVKDEILAFLREEMSGEDLTEYVLSSTYTNLFKTKPPEIGEKMKEVVHNIGTILSRSADVWDRFQARDALVFHLLDIPLEDIPSQITQLAEFFRPLVEAVKTPYPDSSAFLNSFEVFETIEASQDAYSELRTQAFNLADKVNQAIQSVFTEPAEVREQVRHELEALRIEYEKAWAEFQETGDTQVFGSIQPDNIETNILLQHLLVDLSKLSPDFLRSFSSTPDDQNITDTITEAIRESVQVAGAQLVRISGKRNRANDRELSIMVRKSEQSPAQIITILIAPLTKMRS